MKCVILAGGLGTRLSEETVRIPKPMVDIGGRPMLWHIMKIYSAHGVNDFIICLGYRGYVIKEYFANFYLHSSDVTFDLGQNMMEMHRTQSESWRVTLVDTGATARPMRWAGATPIRRRKGPARLRRSQWLSPFTRRGPTSRRGWRRRGRAM